MRKSVLGLAMYSVLSAATLLSAAVPAHAEAILDYFGITQTRSSVHLEWRTTQETNTDAFELLIKHQDEPSGEYDPIGSRIALGGPNIGADYSFDVTTGLIPGHRYCFQLVEYIVGGETGETWEFCGFGLIPEPSHSVYLPVIHEQSPNMIAALKASGNFDTLVEALTAAGLTDALEQAGPFTILASTDTAFAKLPTGALDQLLQNPAGQLTQILLFHILPGKIMSSEITNGMRVTTQQGKTVVFGVADGVIRVNGSVVSTPDIQASNGVIHAIDDVLLPPPD